MGARVKRYHFLLEARHLLAPTLRGTGNECLKCWDKPVTVCKQLPAPEESSQLLSACTNTGDKINQELFSKCVKEKGEII